MPIRKSDRSKRANTRAKSSQKNDIAGFWKALVLGNIILTLFTFYMIYSQNTYIIQRMEEMLPISIALPGDSASTSVVINPITGNFISVANIAPITAILGMLSMIGMYFLIRETL